MKGTEMDRAYLLERVREMMERQKSGAAKVNAERVQEMRRCYALLEPMVRTCRGQISFEQQTLFPTMGSIYVDGEELCFGDPAVLAQALELAGNVEIFSLPDGRIRMFLAFYDLSVLAD